jgi:hypothetical protein
MFGKDFIISPFTKALALLVYLAFFVIQLFFSIDVLNNKAEDNFYASYFSNTTKQNTQKQNVVSHTAKSHTHTFHLNKRFYPESLPESVIAIAYAPSIKLLSVYFSYYKSPLIQAAFDRGLSLRGPPYYLVA